MEENRFVWVSGSFEIIKSKDKNFQIKKSEDDKKRVFGWGQVAVRKDGTVIEDWQGDIVDPEDLEEAAYYHVLNFRNTGEQHNPGLREKGRLIESVILTKEKQEAMGIPEGTVPIGWWVGYQIEDEDTWQKVKSGEYSMFSVEGTGQRVPIEPEVKKGRVSKYLEAVQKFNPYHDNKGRFSSGNGAASKGPLDREKNIRHSEGEQKDTSYATEQAKKTYMSNASEEEIKSITAYCSNDAFIDINEHLRKGKEKTNIITAEERNEIIKNLSNVIEKSELTENTMTYRGSVIQAFGVSKKSELQELTGSTIYDKGFMSTTITKDIIDIFQNSSNPEHDVIMEIAIPKGTKALYPNGNSKFSTENELILQKGSKFKILEVKDGGKNQPATIIAEYAKGE